MNFAQIDNYFALRRVGGVNALASKILDDKELTDDAKLK